MPRQPTLPVDEAPQSFEHSYSSSTTLAIVAPLAQPLLTIISEIPATASVAKTKS